MKKRSEIECASKLAPRFRPLFLRASHARGAMLRGLPLDDVRVSSAILLRQNEREKERRCGGAIVKPARFAEAKRRPSASATTQQMRQARTAPPSGAREARRKRERRSSGRACSNPRNSLSFSISLPKQTNQKLPFGWVLGRGFGLQSRLPNVSPCLSAVRDRNRRRQPAFQPQQRPRG